MGGKTEIEKLIEAAGGTNSLARRLGVTHAAISQWRIRGKTEPPAKYIIQIEEIFGLSRDEIFPRHMEQLRVGAKNGNSKTGNQKKPTKP